ncbi:MAG: hypothetical protein HQK49_20610 [Oligoflexia bacterium]|nr:hypothetical protein [Oligoflexia bacterium]
MTSRFCSACNMPLENTSDIGLTTKEHFFCIHCTHQDKTIKTCTEIFEGGIQFFLNTMPDLNRDFAERIVRKNMNSLSYWNTRKDTCLQGPEASDEEFAEILKRLA